ncbi:hypothetical protein [Roseivirga pacifica]|uniref:hypothetical protein n=1 Tax=Roseivirga pacifica TaxID=1267423 RepID=UPI003BB12D53
MANKSNQQLEEIISKKGDYQKDAVLAAIWELEKRGSGGAEKVELQTAPVVEPVSVKSEPQYTDDPFAPELYPKWSIWVISVLFTPLISGIMLTMNINQINKKKESRLVLTFSILFTAIVLFVVNYAQTQYTAPSSLTNMLNLIGGAVLVEYFWKKHIGLELKYRKRSPLIPFIISISITALLIWAMFA